MIPCFSIFYFSKSFVGYVTAIPFFLCPVYFFPTFQWGADDAQSQLHCVQIYNKTENIPERSKQRESSLHGF